MTRHSKKDANHDATCERCGVVFVPGPESTGRFCGRGCAFAANSPHGTGSDNPNWRGGPPEKVCLTCGCTYFTYDKRRKFCSLKCRPRTSIEKLREMAASAAARRSALSKKQHLRKCVCKVCGTGFVSPGRRLYCDEHRWSPLGKTKERVPNKVCKHCGTAFHTYEKHRIYCSYGCHLASGGARRSGEASAMAKRKYGNKKDANHWEIVNAFERLGASVLDLSDMGCGIPDLIVWCANEWHLVDVKNPKTSYGRRGLNARQKEWAQSWKGGPVYLVSSVDDAIAMANGRLDSVKKFDAKHQSVLDDWRRSA